MQYLETKLILKPDRFKSVESFREFGKIVKRIAKQTEVGFTKDENEICNVSVLEHPQLVVHISPKLVHSDHPSCL